MVDFSSRLRFGAGLERQLELKPNAMPFPQNLGTAYMDFGPGSTTYQLHHNLKINFFIHKVGLLISVRLTGSLWGSNGIMSLEIFSKYNKRFSYRIR